MRTIAATQPLVWLGLGWRDLLHSGWPSLLHGIVLALGGALIVLIAHQRFWLLAGSLSGFMVIAPVLAASLYALSRALERQEPATLGVILKTWLNWQNSHLNKWGNDYWCMVQFGLLLALAATGWVITSAALITLLQAVLTSWRVVLANPVPMAVWAATILIMTLLGLGSLLLGLVLVAPILGHASWHAYRDLVDSSGLPARGDA